jgi:hypothetical protein
MAEWKQVPAAVFQHLVESIPGRVAVIAAKGGPTSNSPINAHDFRMRCSMSKCPHTFDYVVYVNWFECLWSIVNRELY